MLGTVQSSNRQAQFSIFIMGLTHTKQNRLEHSFPPSCQPAPKCTVSTSWKESSNENVLKLTVTMDARLCECTQSHWVVHLNGWILGWKNYISIKLYKKGEGLFLLFSSVKAIFQSAHPKGYVAKNCTDLAMVPQWTPRRPHYSFPARMSSFPSLSLPSLSSPVPSHFVPLV